MPNLRGIKGKGERILGDRKAESDEEFDLGSGEEAEEGYGGRTQRNEPEPTEQGGDSVKKANTRLKIEDELEKVKSDQSRYESETIDLVEQLDLKKPNYLQAKQTKG